MIFPGRKIEGQELFGWGFKVLRGFDGFVSKQEILNSDALLFNFIEDDCSYDAF